MDQLSGLRELLGESLPTLLQSLDEALIILDNERNIRFVNAQARQMLGYGEHDPLDGRCRHTTRGTDCGTACPLTYALERELDMVRDFPTIYRTKDNRPVSLKVTVVPLRSTAGEITGSVEILRPQEADPGFFLAGCSEVAERLRKEVARLAANGAHLLVIGEPPAVTDLTRIIQRLSGLAEEHLHHWQGSWEQVPPWPPGILSLDHRDLPAALARSPQGWRLIAGATPGHELPELAPEAVEVLELPPLSTLRADLPLMISAWVRQLQPGTTLTPEALQRLVQLAEAVGLTELQEILSTAIASAAGAPIERSHLPADGCRSLLIEELLQQPDPLAALEERVLRETLERCGWHMQEAADRLGISRVTLWRKLRDHGIEKQR